MSAIPVLEKGSNWSDRSLQHEWKQEWWYRLKTYLQTDWLSRGNRWILGIMDRRNSKRLMPFPAAKNVPVRGCRLHQHPWRCSVNRELFLPQCSPLLFLEVLIMFLPLRQLAIFNLPSMFPLSHCPLSSCVVLGLLLQRMRCSKVARSEMSWRWPILKWIPLFVMWMLLFLPLPQLANPLLRSVNRIRSSDICLCNDR